MASRSCVSFCSSLHVAFDSVFRCLFLQYREIEFAVIVGHNLPARFEPELFQENGAPAPSLLAAWLLQYCNSSAIFIFMFSYIMRIHHEGF